VVPDDDADAELAARVDDGGLRDAAHECGT
jgi:hypothetical protein